MNHGHLTRRRGVSQMNWSTFNKIITETIPNLEKEMPIRYRRPLGHPIDMTKIELLYNKL
jgi:hypothetical protein